MNPKSRICGNKKKSIIAPNIIDFFYFLIMINNLNISEIKKSNKDFFTIEQMKDKFLNRFNNEIKSLDDEEFLLLLKKMQQSKNQFLRDISENF